MVSTAIFAFLAVGLIAGVNAGSPQKIVGGVPALPGEFPYQVSLRMRGQHMCGGAIVSSRHIVTAAHCVAGFNEPIFVATGTISSTAGELHAAAQILYHGEYRVGDTSSTHDIAVIILADEIIFNAYQNKIDLPSAPTPDGIMACVTGWGYLTASIRVTSPTLNKISLETLTTSECQRKFGNYDLIHSNQICTYSGVGLGTCQGDSGGPLAYNNELVGVVSWGVPCAVGAPDVFTRVSDHVDWLRSIIDL